MNNFWIDSIKLSENKKVENDMTVNTAIIGGGSAGLLTAYYLKKNGISNIVLEANKICSGQSCCTTAKITAQHNLIYDKLINMYGFDLARQYAEANIFAVNEYKRIIDELNINCVYEVLPSFLYTNFDEYSIKKEFDAAVSLGIDCELVNKVNLPFEIKSALKFNDQAQFNPLEFFNSLAKELDIYENSRVTEVKEDYLICNNKRIRAENIVFCCHFPFVNFPGMYFTRLHQSQSYVMVLDKVFNLAGMYYGIDKGALSFREYKNYTIISGEKNRTGDHIFKNPYDTLERKIKEITKDFKVVKKWVAQDCMTNDSIPYIGKFSKVRSNQYVATGFNKWGMTSSLLAGYIISEMINKNETPYPVFSPQRKISSKSYKNYLHNFNIFGKQFLKRIFVKSTELDNIKNGQAGIINYKNEKVGVYKDKDGEIFAVDIKCPHAGCLLEWNENLLTWDCPCHGSRFSYDGKLIDNPANKNID